MAEGTGAPDGGDGAPDGEGKDNFVPKTQFIAAINSANAKHERELQELRAEMEAKLAEAKKPAEAPKRYTRADLTAMVEAGQISKEQADAQMDYQTREDAKADARREAVEVVSAADRKRYVEAEINRYKAVAPEILDDTHEVRQRIKEEYKFLVETMGDPNGLETQLKAIRAVKGPVEKLERALNGRPSHESHRETGGQGGEAKKSDGKLTYDSLSQREKAHYDKGIASGLYKDKAAVNEELAYVNPTTRRKYGAMN